MIIRSVRFFFEAEDCIRGLTVTGVQTCSLPISNTPRVGQLVQHAAHPPTPKKQQTKMHGVLFYRTPDGSGCSRSEERRVGKGVEVGGGGGCNKRRELRHGV